METNSKEIICFFCKKSSQKLRKLIQTKNVGSVTIEIRGVKEEATIDVCICDECLLLLINKGISKNILVKDKNTKCTLCDRGIGPFVEDCSNDDLGSDSSTEDIVKNDLFQKVLYVEEIIFMVRTDVLQENTTLESNLGISFNNTLPIYICNLCINIMIEILLTEAK